MFPVPKNRMQDVIDLLATPADPRAVSEAVEHDVAHGWDDVNLRRLWKDSNPTQREVLAYMAERPDIEVTSREIAADLKLAKGARSLGGIIGGMARRSQNHYGMTDLPWNARWVPIDDDNPEVVNSTETAFQMSHDVAEIILDAQQRSTR